MKLRIITLLGIILFTATVSKGQTNNKYAEVDSLIKAGSLIDAMSALNLLTENHQKDTIDAEYWLRYSRASYIFYKYDEAKAGISRAIRINPKNVVYVFEKGLLLTRISELDSALVYLEKAIGMKPEGEYFYWRGIVHHQLGNIEQAEKDYATALGKGFESPELHNNLAILLSGKEEFNKALDHLNRSVQLNDQYAQAYSARSKMFLYLYNTDSACIDLFKAISFGYTKALDIPDSICNGSVTKKTEFSAELCAATKSFKQAIIGYTKLIEINNQVSVYFLNRGYCYFKTKDYVSAEKDYLKALELPNPVLDLLYDNLSLLYFEQAKYQKSIEYSTKRIELNPKNEVPYIDRGLCYRKLKKYNEAEKEFNKALSINPDFYRAYGYRSYMYLELEKFQQAFDDASKSVQLNPKYGYGYMVLAQAKQALGIPDFCVDYHLAKKYDGPDAGTAIKEFCK